jgi:hypothetical protein
VKQGLDSSDERLSKVQSAAERNAFAKIIITDEEKSKKGLSGYIFLRSFHNTSLI